MSKADTHNEIAKSIVVEIATATGPDAPAAMIIAESVTLGLMLMHYDKPEMVSAALDVLRERVLDRYRMAGLMASAQTRQ